MTEDHKEGVAAFLERAASRGSKEDRLHAGLLGKIFEGFLGVGG
jgi:hypothetical protein